MTIRLALAALAAALVLAACGGSGGGGAAKTTSSERALASVSAKLRTQLEQATRVDLARFPAVRGRTLQDVSNGLDGTGTTVALAGSIFTPGQNRLAFGLLDDDGGYVYAPSVVYLADGPKAPARGPYPAPADLLVTDPAFRSQNAASPDDVFAAIYAAHVRFAKPGRYAILVVSKIDDQLVGAGISVNVVSRDRDPVIQVGAPAPRVDTETLASVGGDKALLDTRRPFDDMHGVSLKDALGTRPVALLFATPQLCQSRVCGPVVDVAAQLKATYGDRVTFIHQEVYKNNDPKQGLREPLRRFGLPTEPWLFLIGTDGTVVRRLEGSFGLREVQEAIEATLAREEESSSSAGPRHRAARDAASPGR